MRDEFEERTEGEREEEGRGRKKIER